MTLSLIELLIVAKDMETTINWNTRVSTNKLLCTDTPKQIHHIVLHAFYSYAHKPVEIEDIYFVLRVGYDAL